MLAIMKILVSDCSQNMHIQTKNFLTGEMSYANRGI